MFWVYIQITPPIFGARVDINNKGHKYMFRQEYCGAYCGPMGYGRMDAGDEVAFLEEEEKILEAKLATIRHMKESATKESGR